MSLNYKVLDFMLLINSLGNRVQLVKVGNVNPQSLKMLLLQNLWQDSQVLDREWNLTLNITPLTNKLLKSTQVSTLSNLVSNQQGELKRKNLIVSVLILYLTIQKLKKNKISLTYYNNPRSLLRKKTAITILIRWLTCFRIFKV